MYPTPIIRSLLDLDFYKLTMAQFAWKHFRDVHVTYAFKNRTKNIALAEVIPERDLREELDYVRTLRFMSDEIDYLRESQYIPRGLFLEDFLEFLATLQLPPVEVVRDGSTYKIEVRGAWPERILWETLILSIVNELYYRSIIAQGRHCIEEVWKEGRRRLEEKSVILKDHPEIKFVDFGTRRRFGREWQEEVVYTLHHEIPKQLLGTSNVRIAKELNIPPFGTFAHEDPMVLSGVFHGSDDEIRASHNKMLQMWWEMYGEPLSVALTDTYGTDFFFRDFTPEQARLWRGLRQDSGDPVEFGEKTIAFYERQGIDPRTKLIVFSDGLDVETIVRLHLHFLGRIKTSFGWGTNLTNDLGFDALSLVVKTVEANGHGLVKLSDNAAKAIGKPEDIKRFKRIFGHTSSFSEECRY